MAKDAFEEMEKACEVVKEGAENLAEEVMAKIVKPVKDAIDDIKGEGQRIIDGAPAL